MKKTTGVLVTCLIAATAACFVGRCLTGRKHDTFSAGVQDTFPSADAGQGERPRLLLPAKEDAPAPPQEWKGDIDELTETLKLPQADVFTLMLNSGDVTTLKTPNEFHGGFRRIPIVSDGEVPEEVRGSLQENIDAFATAFAAFDLTRYGQLMKANSQRLNPGYRETYGHKAAEWGYDPNTITDEQLFAAVSGHLGYAPSWDGIAFETSRIRLYRTATAPADWIGTWAGALKGNIRSFNPSFASENPLSVSLADGPVLYADVSLVVRRGEEWSYEITPFFLRWWYDAKTAQWQFSEATSVKAKADRDKTLFIF
jgi:hypothetical protein